MKKFRSIASLILIIIMVFSSLGTVSASEQSFQFVNYSATSGKLEVCGKVNLYKSEIIVKISNQNDVVYLDSVASDDYGFFNFTVVLDESKVYDVDLTCKNERYSFTADFSREPLKIYVSENSLTGDGSRERPYKNLDDALSYIRTNASRFNSDVQITLLSDLRVDKTVTVDKKAVPSGHRLIIASEEGRMYKIYGTKNVKGWSDSDGDGIYTASYNGTDPEVIFENDNIGYVARIPDMTGNNPYDGKHNYFQPNATSETDPKGTICFNASDIPENLSTDNLRVKVYSGYNYSSELVNVSSIDYENNTIKLSSNANYEILAESRYLLEGAREFLSNKGEYYFDKNQKIMYYIPYNINTLVSAGVEIPVLTTVLNIEADDVVVKNLEMYGGAYTKNYSGSVISLSGANKCEITECKVGNTGGTAIYLGYNSCYNYVHNNYVYNTLNDGISINSSTTPSVKANGNVISNNLVRNIGFLNGNAGCIRVYFGEENLITHNKVENSPRYGIHLKGLIRNRLVNGTSITEENFREYRKTGKNIVSFNDVSKTQLDTQDHGAIATWGVNDGNIISDNYMHNITIKDITRGSSAFGMVFYSDENSDGVIIKNNLIAENSSEGNARLWGLIYPRGEYVGVFNNFMINNPKTMRLFYQQDTPISSWEALGAYHHRNGLYEGNVSYNNGNTAFEISTVGNPDEAIAYSDQNVFDKQSDQLNIKKGRTLLTLSGWQELGFDENSKYDASPFLNPSERDYRLSPESVVYSDNMEIKELDMLNMGLKEDFFLKTKSYPDRVFVRAGGAKNDVSFTTLKVQKNVKLNVFFRDTDGFLHGASDAVIVPENPEIVEVNNGVVTALAPGKTTINVTVTSNGVSKTIPYYVTVEDEEYLTILDEEGNKVTEKSQLSPNMKLKVYSKYADKHNHAIISVYDENSLASVGTNAGRGKFSDYVTLPEDITGIKIKAMLWFVEEARPLVKCIEID